MNNRVVQLVTGAIVLAAAVALAVWLLPRDPAVRIAGTEGALARAAPESEFILPAALEAAREEAARRGVRALIVHRRGHRVFEYFPAGVAGTDLVDGGELATAVLQLTQREADDAGLQDATALATLVSERLWLPLRAGEAWLSGAPGAPRHCCIEARLDDWMRVGDLLLGTGSYLGERFVPADAVRALLAGRQPPWRGDEPLLARDGTAFDLSPRIRLWLAPRRQLAVLVWADAEVARDTLLPNVILRGLNDAAPAIDAGIGDIVPGH
jgi:hypothetical protein